MKKFFSKIGSKLKSLYERYRETKFSKRFRGLSTLVMMQLKDKLNMSFKADKKGALTKLILRIVLFVVTTAAIVIIMMVMNLLNVWPGYAGVPVPVFTTIFVVMMLLSIITCISGLTKSLYFSRDNLTLLAYPVNSNTVFVSKLIVYYIISLIKEATFLLPLFLAYGIANKFSFGYFPWLILMYFVLCAVPVAIASVISIPWMYIQLLLRKNPLAQDLLFVAVLIAATVFLFIVIDKIPADLHFLTQWGAKYLPIIINFTCQFIVWLTPISYLCLGIISSPITQLDPKGIGVVNGQSCMIFGITIASIAILILITYLFAKPIFLKMAAKPFEFKKRIIFHNYSISKQRIRTNYYEIAFAPASMIGVKLNSNQKIAYKNFYEKVLNQIVKEVKLFKKGVNENKIIRTLNEYTGDKFVPVPVDEFTEQKYIGFIVEKKNGINELVLAKSTGVSYVECYNPYYLSKTNHPKTPFVSALFKDFLMSIRTPGTLLSGYCLLMVGPLAIALMNKVFSSINTSFMGDQYVIMFNILVMTLIPLVSNVSMASIYSREGESSYLLKASPSNYLKTLTAKLLLRWFLVVASIILTVVVYNHYCDVFFNKPVLLAITLICLYTGHLIWSAELDFMRPQDQLYKEVGEGNISNPNESASGIIAFIITAIFTVISLILIQENSMNVFYKLLLIGAIFLVARIILAVLKIKGYKTSRGERGRD